MPQKINAEIIDNNNEILYVSDNKYNYPKFNWVCPQSGTYYLKVNYRRYISEYDDKTHNKENASEIDLNNNVLDMTDYNIKSNATIYNTLDVTLNEYRQTLNPLPITFKFQLTANLLNGFIEIKLPSEFETENINGITNYIKINNGVIYKDTGELLNNIIKFPIKNVSKEYELKIILSRGILKNPTVNKKYKISAEVRKNTNVLIYAGEHIINIEELLDCRLSAEDLMIGYKDLNDTYKEYIDPYYIEEKVY